MCCVTDAAQVSMILLTCLFPRQLQMLLPGRCYVPDRGMQPAGAVSQTDAVRLLLRARTGAHTCASCDRLSSCCLVVTPFASQSVDQLNEYRCRVRAASRIWVRCRSLAWTSCAWKYGCRRDMLSLSGSECLAVNLFTFRSLNDTACKIACRLLRLEALHAQHRRLRLAYHRAGLGETWH